MNHDPYTRKPANSHTAFRDRYGFLFWLGWILWFAGSFILSAVSWTFLLQSVFGVIHGGELTLTWCVAVFGSWFLLVIPFMRKKEQIWKRLNDDQERAVDAWLLGMSIFIGLLIVSSFSWSIGLRSRLTSPGVGGIDPLWAKAVFGTWLALLIPFLVVMYRQADRIFQTANARQTYSPNYRRQSVDRPERLLPDLLVKKLKKLKPALPGGHLVKVTLKDGRTLNHVFIRNQNEIAGIYDAEAWNFKVSDIADVQNMDLGEASKYEEARWLRLDVP